MEKRRARSKDIVVPCFATPFPVLSTWSFGNNRRLRQHAADSVLQQDYKCSLVTARLASSPPPIPPVPSSPEPDGRPDPNKLAHETSWYLQSHAQDLVDWFPWGEEAFYRAKALGRPIFLSSGFATCHWCHVMMRHLNTPKIANMLNENFVSIMVDREERPDVDNVYMTFVQAVSGRCGWPMTVFLTPELVPFVGATYLPADRLLSAVQSIADRWKEQRFSVEADGAKVLEALRDLSDSKRRSNGKAISLGPESLRAAYEAASASFDVIHGGFGPPPKFPRASLFEFLFGTHLLHTSDALLSQDSLDMVNFTLMKMLQGGVHDHLGGGFFRYTMDSAWQAPRFEKLLSDQAQLALSYLFAYLISDNTDFRYAVERTLDFCLDNMLISSVGAFASAMDSDSVSQFDVESKGEAKEGAFYTISEWELKLMLGEPTASLFAMRYGIRPEGNVVDSERGSEFTGLNILRVSKSIELIADSAGMQPAQVERLLEAGRQKLLAERNRRPHPVVDDLVIACWNAMAVSALARAGRTLMEPRYLYAAFRAMEHIITNMVSRVDEESGAVFLLRAFRQGHGRGRVEAFAEDYCACIQACIDCFETAPPHNATKYLDLALRLQRALDMSFWDGENGGYFASTEEDKSILIRRREDYDGAEPSASSVAALNCIRLASLTGDQTLWKRAREICSAFAAVLAKAPLAMPLLLVSVQALEEAGTKRVVIIGDDETSSSFLSAFWSCGLPRSVALLRLPLDGPSSELAALLSDASKNIRVLHGKATAYVCTGSECLEPTDNLQRFSEQLNYLQKAQVSRAPR